jgi:hypothetical protein
LGDLYATIFILQKRIDNIDFADQSALQLVARSGPRRFFAIGDFPPHFLEQEELNVSMVGAR